MDFKRILNFAAAVAAVAAAVAVCIVAASFAIYALAREYIGPAGGAAVVTAVFAVVAVVVALLATRKVTPKTAAAPPPSPVDKAIAIAREHPIVAVGAAAVAVTVMVRNPAMVTALVSAFLAGNNTAPPKK